MADNQDYKDIEHMTNFDRNAEDIDILFNDQDNMKIIFPNKEELKDFPEERLNEDYISDEDLDFVDSMLEEESSSNKDNIELIEKSQNSDTLSNDVLDNVKLPETETTLNNFDNIDLKLDIDNSKFDKIDVLDDIELKMENAIENVDSVKQEEESEESEESEKQVEEILPVEDNIISDEISVSDESVSAVNSEPEVEKVEEPKKQTEEPEEEPAEEPAEEPEEEPEEKTEEPKEEEVVESEEEQSIPEINAINDDSDRIEIVVKNIDQDVILPPSEDEQLSDDILLQDTVDTPSNKVENVETTEEISFEDVKKEEEVVQPDTQKSDENNKIEETKRDFLSADSGVKQDDIIYIGQIKDNIHFVKDEETTKNISDEKREPEIQFLDSEMAEKEIPINISKYGTQNSDFEIVESEEDAQSESSDNIEFLTFEETDIAEEKEPKSEEEELLDENVFSVCNIDSKRGFYFGKSPKAYALYGYINDEIFMLKEFSEFFNSNLGFRLQEKTKQSSSYLVKVNDSKLLVNVDKESMSVVLEL